MRVLIADDSRAMRMIMLRALRLSGVILDEVVDGADALAAVAGFEPDLILSDWSMPTTSGIDLLHQLRAQRDLTPFGFVTSR